jgi:hypothetical protein
MDSIEKIRPCPICHKPVPPRSEAKAYPFCSERCQLLDLGEWLDGTYALAGEPDSSSE